MLHLEMDEDDLAELYARDPMSDDRLPGRMLHADNGVEDEVELRFRGASSRFHPKRSFNVRFSERQDFLWGSDRMNLKAMYADPTLMREVLAMQMWRELDRPAPRTRYFDLHINGVYEGLYVHVERVDHDLAAHHGLASTDEEGTLVRDGFRDAPALGALSAFDYPLEDADDPEELLGDNLDSRGEPDVPALIALVRWVRETPPGAAFARGLEERFDLDVLIDWLAIHELIQDVDSYRDDYWLHLDHADPEARWVVIPWDKDLSFGSHYRPEEHGAGTNEFFTYDYPRELPAEAFGNVLVQKLFATPQLAERLDERVLELRWAVFDDAWLADRIAELDEAIRDSLTREPGPDSFRLHPGNQFSSEPFDDQLAVLTEFWELRGAYLDRQVLGTPPATPASGGRAEVAGEVGSRTLLTDRDGWTAGALTLREAVDVPAAVALDVRRRPGLDGVDRVYTVRSDRDLVVDIDLYYRNDVPGVHTVPGESWWGTDEPVGDQHDLVIAVLDDTGATTPLTSSAHPLTNRVRAAVELDAGVTSLVLVRR